MTYPKYIPLPHEKLIVQNEGHVLVSHIQGNNIVLSRKFWHKDSYFTQGAWLYDDDVHFEMTLQEFYLLKELA